MEQALAQCQVVKEAIYNNNDEDQPAQSISNSYEQLKFHARFR